MNMALLNAFLSGAIALGYGAIALFFLGYWRRLGIRLFGCFAVAFALLAIERPILVFVEAQDEFQPAVYLIRLAAFLVIIVGIVLQNRRPN